MLYNNLHYTLHVGTSDDTALVSSITVEPRPRIAGIFSQCHNHRFTRYNHALLKCTYQHNFSDFIQCKGNKFEITGGNLTFTSKWIPKPHIELVLANEVLNFCDLIVQLSHTCPLHPGSYVFFFTRRPY